MRRDQAQTKGVFGDFVSLATLQYLAVAGGRSILLRKVALPL